LLSVFEDGIIYTSSQKGPAHKRQQKVINGPCRFSNKALSLMFHSPLKSRHSSLLCRPLSSFVLIQLTLSHFLQFLFGNLPMLIFDCDLIKEKTKIKHISYISFYYCVDSTMIISRMKISLPIAEDFLI
jgi:hypothetical protein